MTKLVIPRCGLWIILLAGLTACTPAAGGAGGDAMVLMNQGIERMEEYQYGEAYRIFDQLAKNYPTWEAAQVNRGIAALNRQKDDQEGVDYLPIAEQAFTRALELNPKSIHALVCRGMLYQHLNRSDDMLRDYSQAAQLDPLDPYILCQKAVALIEKGKSDEAAADLTRVLKIQPSFATALYRMREIAARRRDMKAMTEAIERFKRLEATEVGLKTGLKYGEGGKYSLTIRNQPPPGGAAPTPAPAPAPAGPPAFQAAQQITERAVAPRVGPDGKGLPPGFALGEIDGDASLELLVPGELDAGGKPGLGLHGLKAGGWGLRQRFELPDAQVCAFGDLDGDLDTDAAVAGPGWLRWLENTGDGKLEVRELAASGATFAGIPVRLVVADADSDWDLDLICLRSEKTPEGKLVSRVEILNNNRNGTYQEIATRAGVGPFDFAATELVVADLDDDVDPDLLVLDGATGAARVFANDRVWTYRAVEAAGEAPRAPGVVATTGLDWDGDGDEDLVHFCGTSAHLWVNEGQLQFREDQEFARRLAGAGASAGAAGDFFGVMGQSLLVLGPPGARLLPPGAGSPVSLELAGAGVAADRSAVATVLAEGRGPELIVVDTVRGAHSFPLAPNARWFVVDLEGAKKWVSKQERANPGGVGGAVEVKSGARALRLFLHGGAGGSGRAPIRAFCGVSNPGAVDYVRIIWPDGVLQSERGLAGGKIHRIREIERKPSSCPILFAWTARGYEFVADFLGVGGLGYFEQPGSYSKPDPSEYVLLPELASAADGSYKVDVLEPLEECTYLDELKLTVVEHDAGVTVIPDEMFAVKGPQPGFHLWAFRDREQPVAASDQAGREVTENLLAVDRKYANTFERDARFPGLARQMHWIDLDFGDRIQKLFERNPQAHPVLFLHGFVEYGYSTSNFAAWQAEATFHAPSVRAEREGRWVTLRDEWGFPGGYPRYMTIDLAGALWPGDRKLRVDTNLELHWDQIFLADASVEDLKVLDLSGDTAELGFRGYPREVSPDGALPLLYVHGEFEPEAPYRVFPGAYTRHGDVRELLSAADDRLAILGPGDGLELTVRADSVGPLPQGKRRTFLLKAFGYCKDMDLYTAHPDRIEPLPFRAMSGYPFPAAEMQRSEELRAAYAPLWNTRIVK